MRSVLKIRIGNTRKKNYGQLYRRALFLARSTGVPGRSPVSVARSSGASSLRLQSASLFGRWLQFLRWSRPGWLPFAVVSSVLIAWLANPGWLGPWGAVLFVLFGALPRPWRARRPPSLRSPAGHQWLAQQRAASAARRGRVYRLWSPAEWAARSAALPWARRPRFFTRGPA